MQTYSQISWSQTQWIIFDGQPWCNNCYVFVVPPGNFTHVHWLLWSFASYYTEQMWIVLLLIWSRVLITWNSYILEHNQVNYGWKWEQVDLNIRSNALSNMEKSSSGVQLVLDTKTAGRSSRKWTFPSESL